MNAADSPMQRQARCLPSLIKDQYRYLEPKTRHLFSNEEIFSFRKIVLSGCGDSYAACLASKMAFEEFARVPVDVVTSIDLARHYSRPQLNCGPNSPLVISLSHSGQIVRVGEGILRANTTSLYTLALTSNSDSLVGRNAKKSLLLDPPNLELCPGVSSYGISLLALLLLAIRMGEVKMTYTMDHAGLLRDSLITGMDEIESQMEDIENQISNLADRWSTFLGYDFVGSGPDYAAVFYGHAKIIEAVGRYAMHVNTEEWLHLNCFLRDSETTGTVLIVNKKNAAISRAREVLQYMQMNRRPLLLISDDPDFANQKYDFILVPETPHQSFSALVQFIPLAFLSAIISNQIGEVYGRGAVGNWAFCADGAAVKESKILVVKD